MIINTNIVQCRVKPPLQSSVVPFLYFFLLIKINLIEQAIQIFANKVEVTSIQLRFFTQNKNWIENCDVKIPKI